MVPTRVAPWRRIRIIQCAPSAFASDWPSSGLTTSMLVSPNSSRLSQNGAAVPSTAPMWNTGTSSMPVMQNGRTDGEWWWQTALTSGRAW